MTELRDVLERTTDRIEASDLAGEAAMARARQMRLRRRAVAGSIVAMAALVVVAVLAGSNRPNPDVPPAEPVPPSATYDPDLGAPQIEPSAIQPVWDVEAASGLPVRETRLPEVIERPDSSAPLKGNNDWGFVVALWGEPDLIYLLGVDGTWRHTSAPTDRPWTAQLFGDGTRMAMTGSDGIWWIDLREGTWRRVAYPTEMTEIPGVDVTMRWTGSEEVVVSSRGSWLVDLVGKLEPVKLPYPDVRTNGFDVDAHVSAVQTGIDHGGPNGSRIVTEWQGQQLVQTRFADSLDMLERPLLHGDRFVAMRTTGFSGPRPDVQRDGVVVVDRDQLATLSYLPLDDEDGYYGEDGHLSPVSWLDERTVLLMVESKAGDWYLIAWDYVSGSLTRVAQWSPEVSITSVAGAVLVDP